MLLGNEFMNYAIKHSEIKYFYDMNQINHDRILPDVNQIIHYNIGSLSIDNELFNLKKLYPAEIQLIDAEMLNAPEDNSASEDADLKAIRDFFRDESRVLRELKKLAHALEVLAKEKDLYDDATGGLKGYMPHAPFKQHKLLSGYLYQWASQNGFSAPVAFEHLLDENDFRKVLRDGSLFKDKIFGNGYHGEWTHFIQWWCVVEANREQQFLATPPHELFRWLGTKDSSVWFNTFEIPLSVRASMRGRFGSVIQFGEYLLSAECATVTPVLHQLISGRMYKRMVQPLPFSFFKSGVATSVPSSSLRINNESENTVISAIDFQASEIKPLEKPLLPEFANESARMSR